MADAVDHVHGFAVSQPRNVCELAVQMRLVDDEVDVDAYLGNYADSHALELLLQLVLVYHALVLMKLEDVGSNGAALAGYHSIFNVVRPHLQALSQRVLLESSAGDGLSLPLIGVGVALNGSLGGGLGAGHQHAALVAPDVVALLIDHVVVYSVLLDVYAHTDHEVLELLCLDSLRPHAHEIHPLVPQLLLQPLEVVLVAPLIQIRLFLVHQQPLECLGELHISLLVH